MAKKKKTWEGLTPRQRLTRAIRGMRVLADEYERTYPNWLQTAALGLLRGALWSLRQYMDPPQGQRPEGEAYEALDTPFVELEYAVKANWDAWGPGGSLGLEWGQIREEDTRTRDTTIKAVERTFLPPWITWPCIS